MCVHHLFFLWRNTSSVHCGKPFSRISLSSFLSLFYRFAKKRTSGKSWFRIQLTTLKNTIVFKRKILFNRPLTVQSKVDPRGKQGFDSKDEAIHLLETYKITNWNRRLGNFERITEEREKINKDGGGHWRKASLFEWGCGCRCLVWPFSTRVNIRINRYASHAEENNRNTQRATVN